MKTITPDKRHRWLPREACVACTRFSVPAFLLLLVLSSGCVSPLDPDTPRRRIVADVPADPEPPGRVPATIVDIVVYENGVRWHDLTSGTTASIDTSSHAVWQRLSVHRSQTDAQNAERVSGLILRLDSISVPREQFVVSGNPRGGTGFAIIVSFAAPNNTRRYDTLFTNSTGTLQTMLLTLAPDSARRSIACSGSVNLPAHRTTIDLFYRVRY